MTRASPVEDFAEEQGGGKINELSWCGCGRVEELVGSEYTRAASWSPRVARRSTATPVAQE